jgi:predicted PurR-regulated permease PerM
MESQLTRDLTRTTFAVLFIGTLLALSLWILRPFLGPVVWATMIVVATWPVLLRVQARLGGRRWLAVGVMALALLLLFVVPLLLAISTIVGNADRLVDWARFLATWRVPEHPPAWVLGLPMIGDNLERLWREGTALGLRDLLPRLTPYAGDLTRWFVAEVGGFGLLAFQFVVTLGVAMLLYATGEDAAQLARRFARRLAGDRGVGAVDLAGGAIRGVALGVGLTALGQALLGGVGLWLAGIPAAGLLTALMFMLCIAGVGPLPVLVPAGLWLLFGSGEFGWGIFLLVWSAFVGTVDNFIRPVLIRMGADLPLLLIFAGVIGGLFAFGLVGIFVGPVVLAVAWTLLDAWMADADPVPEPPPPRGQPAPEVKVVVAAEAAPDGVAGGAGVAESVGSEGEAAPIRAAQGPPRSVP